MTLTKPTLHLNGTDRGTLRTQIHNARSALRAATSALQEMAPNARDYYPQGEGAYTAAVAEHQARCRKLDEVGAELSELAWSIVGNG